MAREAIPHPAGSAELVTGDQDKSSAALWVAPLADLFSSSKTYYSLAGTTLYLRTTRTKKYMSCTTKKTPPPSAARTSLGRHRRVNGNGNRVTGWRLDCVCRLLKGFGRCDLVNVCPTDQYPSRWHAGGTLTSEDTLESRLDVRGIQRRSLDERQLVFTYKTARGSVRPRRHPK